MEKDLYSYGLLAMVVDILIHAIVMDIQTAFSHYQYQVLHKGGKFKPQNNFVNNLKKIFYLIYFVMK